jgi:hypothetical protein
LLHDCCRNTIIRPTALKQANIRANLETHCRVSIARRGARHPIAADRRFGVMLWAQWPISAEWLIGFAQ